MLQWETPSGMFAKFHTVETSNNRDLPARSLSLSPSGSTIICTPGPQAFWRSLTKIALSRSLCYCLFAPPVYGWYSSRTSCSWWITHLVKRQEVATAAQSGLSPGSRSRGAKKQKEEPKTRRGDHILKIKYWMYAANGGPNVKWGGRAPLAPLWRCAYSNLYSVQVLWLKLTTTCKWSVRMRKSTPPTLQTELKKITVRTICKAAMLCCRKVSHVHEMIVLLLLNYGDRSHDKPKIMGKDQMI